MAREVGEKIVSQVPREFVTQPFFPARKQTAPRVLHIDGVTWTIGVPRPDRRQPPVAFDMRHGRVCFALLSFRDRLDAAGAIRFSINELAHRMAHSNGGRYSRDLLNLLFDLRDTWVRLDYPEGPPRTFSVIGGIDVLGSPSVRRRPAVEGGTVESEFWLDRVTLHPEFFKLMNRIERQTGLRLDVLIGMTSDAAQSIYTFLPSRAARRSAANPFEITLTTLMEQIGMTVPPHRSKRLQVFTQRSPSIIDQLNGAETLTGVLRVEVAETVDGDDYKVRTWVEVRPPALAAPSGDSTLLKAWTEAGRTKREFDRRVRSAPELTDHQVYLIGRAGATLAGNERFFRMAAALLGAGRFEGALSEAKGDALEGRPARNPTGSLIVRLMNAIRSPKK